MSGYKIYTFEEMMQEVNSYIKNEDNLAFVRKAYFYAEKMHDGVIRKSGEPYITHPIQVATYLAQLHAGPSTLAAALLHDVVEDCNVDIEEFKKEFSEEVYKLVDGVTKISNIEFKDDKEYQAANHRKILIAMANDIRVILIKLCDRLHNMRTLKYMSYEKQQKIAQETLDVYAPIAHRLGISEIKNELEDLSFYYLNPEKYHEIAKLVEQKRSTRDEQIKKMILGLDEVLSDKKINFRIFGRSKHLYSIYNKMVKKNKRFDEILDLLAIRIVCENTLNCYEILGWIHAKYTPIPGRLKDYIAMPKFNMYQSLHTTIMGEDGNIFEIQIRTEEMDEIAERGVAAHWRYKEGKYNAKKEQEEIGEKLSLFKDIMAIKDEEDMNDEDFMNTLQKDIFDTNVYVMSPKGRVIDLPQGSTPIDFAYRIHTEIGHTTVGATVNGVLVPLNTPLKTGDVVSLKTSKQSAGPSEDWLKFVKTAHARNKIRAYLTQKELESRNPLIQEGEKLIKQEAEKRDIDLDLISPKKMEPIAREFNHKNLDDFYYAVGNKALSVVSIFEKIVKKAKIINPTLTTDTSFVKVQNKKKVSDCGVIVAGIDTMMVSLSGCCLPILGDEIVGFITKGNGVKVHRADCVNIAKEKSRLIPVEWDPNYEGKYETEISIESTDRVYLLTDLVTIISQCKANIVAVNSAVLEDKIHALTSIKLVVNNLDHLNLVMSNLRKVESVTSVNRKNS